MSDIGMCVGFYYIDSPGVADKEQSTTLWSETWLGTTITRGKRDLFISVFIDGIEKLQYAYIYIYIHMQF